MKSLGKTKTFVLAICLMGCQEFVKITIEKMSITNPVFGIESASIFGDKGVAIPNFSVAKEGPMEGSGSALMWRIESETGARVYVREIVYGVVPEGFKEVITVKALQPNQSY